MNNPELGISGAAFPSTSWALVNQLRGRHSPERRAHLQKLVELYWKPVYCLIRRQWARTNEDAEDMTQEFFLRAVLEGSLLHTFEADRGSFRAFLKGAIANFMCNRVRDAKSQKRGGHVKVLSLDTAEIADLLQNAHDLSPEQMFDVAWKNVVLARALRVLEERLKAEGKEIYFNVFTRYDVQPQAAASYKTIGVELGLSADVVKHYLAKARTEYRNAVTELVCDYVDSPKALHSEMKELFGS